MLIGSAGVTDLAILLQSFWQRYVFSYFFLGVTDQMASLYLAPPIRECVLYTHTHTNTCAAW